VYVRVFVSETERASQKKRQPESMQMREHADEARAGSREHAKAGLE